MKFILMLFFLAVTCLTGVADLRAASVNGYFTIVEGRVDILKKGAEAVLPVALGDKVEVGDIVRTKSNSRAQIEMQDKSLLNLAENSRVEIRRFSITGGKEKKRDGLFRIFRGQLRSIVNRNDDDTEFNFQVETPTAVAAVRGTDFVVKVDQSSLQSMVACLNGMVGVTSIKQTAGAPMVVTIGANQYTLVAVNRGPTTPKTMTPAQVNKLFSEATEVKSGGQSFEGSDQGNGGGDQGKGGGDQGNDGGDQGNGGGDQDNGGDGTGGLPGGSGTGGSGGQSDVSLLPTTDTGGFGGFESAGGTSGGSPTAPTGLTGPTTTTPVTPPITSSTPSILTAPVTIQVNF